MKHRATCRGSVLIEFTVAMSFLLLFVAAICDLARVFYYSDITTTAARAGVQYAIALPGNSARLDQIEAAALAEPGNLPGLTATAADRSTQTAAGSTKYVEVTTTYRLHTLVSWPGFANPVSIQGRALIRVE